MLNLKSLTPTITCFNTGDSRAIVVALKDGQVKVEPLSYDHKPNLPAEKE